MALCSNCGEKQSNNGQLCIDCYKKKKHHEKQLKFRYKNIKGRIAERIIEELFLTLGYKVFRYGMENSIYGIMDYLKGIQTNVAKYIRHMPDFVVYSEKTREVFFLEVKFRANGEFIYDGLGADYPYDNAYIILVSKKHIKCASVEELKEGKPFQLLGDRKEFKIDKIDREIIKKFCTIAVKFFENA